MSGWTVSLRFWIHETLQNFSSFKQPIEKMKIKVFWMSRSFSRFHVILNQTDICLCHKFQLPILTYKKVLFLKKYELSHIVLFWTNRWRNFREKIFHFAMWLCASYLDLNYTTSTLWIVEYVHYSRQIKDTMTTVEIHHTPSTPLGKS